MSVRWGRPVGGLERDSGEMTFWGDEGTHVEKLGGSGSSEDAPKDPKDACQRHRARGSLV